VLLQGWLDHRDRNVVTVIRNRILLLDRRHWAKSLTYAFLLLYWGLRSLIVSESMIFSHLLAFLSLIFYILIPLTDIAKISIVLYPIFSLFLVLLYFLPHFLDVFNCFSHQILIKSSYNVFSCLKNSIRLIYISKHILWHEFTLLYFYPIITLSYSFAIVALLECFFTYLPIFTVI